MKIDDLIFSKFVGNALTKSQMMDVEKQLIADGEFSAAMEASVIDYRVRQNEADSMLGTDENDSSINNNTENVVRNEDSYDSEETKTTCLTTNNSVIMNNVNFTKEEMVKVTERYNTIVKSNKAELSLKENLVNAYMSANPAKTKEEAEDIVKSLIAGCDTLTRKYNEALSNGFNAEAEITSICEGKSIKEKYSFLINALAMVETLNLDSFASLTDINDTVKKAIEEYNAAAPEPTEKDCETMEKLLSEALANNTILVSGLEKARTILTTANEGTSSVVDFTSEQYDDARQKAEMALAAWLEYEAGGISSAQHGASPEAIGIGAATAVEEAKIMSDVTSGSKTTDIAIKCLKVLGGVALTCLMGYYGILAASLAGGAIAYGLLSVLGTSFLACIATMVLVIPVLWGMADLGVNAGAYILEKAGDAYDYVIEKLRESIFPKIAEVAKGFVDWLKSKFEHRSGQVEVAPVVAPA